MLDSAAVVDPAALPSKIYKIAYHGKLQAVAAWLDSGGNVDASLPGNNSTLLMVASFRGHHQLVRLLLDRGATVALRNSVGHTALKLADHCVDHDAAASIHSMLLQADSQSRAPADAPADASAGAAPAPAATSGLSSSSASPRTVSKVTPTDDPSASPRQQRRSASASPAGSGRVALQPQGSIQRAASRGRGGRADGGRGGRARAR